MKKSNPKLEGTLREMQEYELLADLFVSNHREGHKPNRITEGYMWGILDGLHNIHSKYTKEGMPAILERNNNKIFKKLIKAGFLGDRPEKSKRTLYDVIVCIAIKYGRER